MSQFNKRAVIIAAVAVVLAAAVGTTAFFMLRDRGVAAVVNGVKITEEQVQTEIDKAVAQYEAQGMGLQPEQLAQVRSTIIDNLVTREILIQASVEYELTEEEIETQMASFRERFDDEEKYMEALSMQGYDLETFRKVIVEDMRIQNMIEDKVPEVTSVSDDEILAFYNDNPTYFTEPERIHASHILVSMEDKTTDEQKTAALEKIERIKDELDKGADFAETAIRESEGPSGPNGGDLGEFPRGQMVSSFENVAFNLPAGSISGVVETQFGYHIIKVHERFPESSVPLEDVKESISSYLLQELSQSNLTQFLENLKSSAEIRIPGKKSTALSTEV